jgi:hypothetical protein
VFASVRKVGKTVAKQMAWMVLGVGAGVGLVMYLLGQREEQAQSARRPQPKQKIVIPPPIREEAKPGILKLNLTAEPAKFVRREQGTVAVETLPGASCKLKAVYSTNRKPSGLDEGPVAADSSGNCRWTWPIGTGGSHVDVTVWASLSGYEDAEASLRIEIVD